MIFAKKTKILLLFIILNSFTSFCIAKDFGIRGKVWDIKEKDIIEQIRLKLEYMEKNGELKRHNEILKDKVVNIIRNPKSLGIERAKEDREYYFDPTIIVGKDLVGSNGEIFHKKGERFNPLEKVSMNYELIFFNGEDKQQLEFALDRYKKSFIKPKLILTGGSPVIIEKQYGIDSYFDQNSILIKKMGIRAVPALVLQEGMKLKIKEVKL